MREQSLHVLSYGRFSLVRGSFQSLSFAISKHPYAVLALLLAVALVYWLWFGMTQRSIDGNDGISLLAIRGIVEHGYQKLPSGDLYHRGYIPHYLAAASIKIFGFNELSYRLPSLAMGLGVLWLVFLFAKDVVRRPWLGVTTAMILLALQVEAIYATSPRMYMALQFFTILAAYSTWRGFVLGEKSFQVVTYVAVACAILSHSLGVVLLVALPVSALAAVRLRRQGLPRVSPLLTLIGWSLVLAAAYFMGYISLQE